MSQYLDLEGLQRYDEKIKSLFEEGSPAPTKGTDYVNDVANLSCSKAQHFETQVTYNGTPYDGTLISQQSASKDFATQLFIGWVGIVLRRTRQGGNWGDWAEIPVGNSNNGITELSAQYVRITDLDTGIYKLTYNGNKYIYYNGHTSTNYVLVYSGTDPCVLYVQRYVSTTPRWEWHYFYASTNAIKKITIGSTSESSGAVSSLVLPTSMGTIGQFLKSNGTGSAPTWAAPSVSLPFDTWDGSGNSGSIVLPSGGWYYICQVPGSGILFQAESNYSTPAQIFEIQTATDTTIAIETSYSSSTGIVLNAKKKVGTGAWTDVTMHFYYKKL